MSSICLTSGKKYLGELYLGRVSGHWHLVWVTQSEGNRPHFCLIAKPGKVERLCNQCAHLLSSCWKCLESVPNFPSLYRKSWYWETHPNSPPPSSLPGVVGLLIKSRQLRLGAIGQRAGVCFECSWGGSSLVVHRVPWGIPGVKPEQSQK